MEIKRSDKLSSNNSSSNVNGPPEYAARDLTKNGEIAHISLQEKMYTLRITRAGKLILTK
jgi:hemin uptake protein HemP